MKQVYKSLTFMKKTFLPTLSKIFPFLICFLFVFLALRGQLGNPSAVDVNTINWKDNGPFELSPERGRYALTYSLIEDKSFYFSTSLARFAIPDLGYKNGHYVSLFAPGVSFIAIPGYLVGKLLGASQVGTFAAVSLFAILNLILIKRISKLLGASGIASWLAALVFLFATPAFAYAVDLYQHHISTFLILLSVYIVIKAKKVWPLFFIWFLCATSIPVDYPNAVLMFPIGIAALFKMIRMQNMFGKLNIKIPIVNFLVFLGILFPLVFFMWFNYKSYGNPFQFSGTVESIREIDSSGNPKPSKTADPEHVDEYLNPSQQKKSVVIFFSSRSVLNGFYMHFLSPDRGVVTFTPIVLFGLVGIYLLHKKREKHLAMLVGILGADVIIYSLWGDPWGGWAFGSRYLIPGYAILAIFISIFLTKLQEGGLKKLLLIPFFVILAYSICVNTLGAITTSANPPQVEALPLEKLSGKRERYSFDRNWEFLTSGKSKSFVFQTWASKYLTAQEYYYLIAGSLIASSLGLTVALTRKKKNE